MRNDPTVVTFARHANPPPRARPDRLDRPAHPSQGGPIRPEAGLSLRPEAGLYPGAPTSYPGPAAPALAAPGGQSLTINAAPRHTPRGADRFLDPGG